MSEIDQNQSVGKKVCYVSEVLQTVSLHLGTELIELLMLSNG